MKMSNLQWLQKEKQLQKESLQLKERQQEEKQLQRKQLQKEKPQRESLAVRKKLLQKEKQEDDKTSKKIKSPVKWRIIPFSTFTN